MGVEAHQHVRGDQRVDRLREAQVLPLPEVAIKACEVLGLAREVQLLPQGRSKLAHALLEVQIPQNGHSCRQSGCALHEDEIALHDGAHTRVPHLHSHHSSCRLAGLVCTPLRQSCLVNLQAVQVCMSAEAEAEAIQYIKFSSLWHI